MMMYAIASGRVALIVVQARHESDQLREIVSGKVEGEKCSSTGRERERERE